MVSSLIKFFIEGSSRILKKIEGNSVVRPLNLNVADGPSEVQLEDPGSSVFVVNKIKYE
jgi:hypothetical protein